MVRTKLTFNFLVLFCSFFFFDATSQEGASSKIEDTNTFSLEDQDLGLLESGVNLFTGDVQFPVKVISVPGQKDIGIDVTFNYNSNVEHQVSTFNEEAPTGILGLGWSMEFPVIHVDHKNTATQHDDNYYLIEGGVSTELFYISSETFNSRDLGSNQTGEKFEAKTYKNWKIRYIPTKERWEITKDDGSIYVFGDINNHPTSIQWIVRWGNWIGDSNITSGQSQMAMAWNLSRVTNYSGDYANYSYLKHESKVGATSGLLQTEASYLSHIENQLGYEVTFNYTEKQSYEYFEPHIELINEPDAYQERYEKMYLSTIELAKNGNSLKTVTVNYFPLTKLSSTDAFKKRLISSIQSTDKFGSNHVQMSFDYYTSGALKGFLSNVTNGTGAIVSYSYQTKSIGDLDFSIAAPSGYAEPKIWHGPDYTVVAWRQLGAGGSHDDGDKTVQVYVYYWEGEWKSQFIKTITNVSREVGFIEPKPYAKFRVITLKDHFAIATQGTGNNCELYVAYRNANSIWTVNSYLKDIGGIDPYLIGGNQFVAIGNIGSKEVKLFVRGGDTWREEPLNASLTGSNFQTTGTNNYVFTQYFDSPSVLTKMNFLRRDKSIGTSFGTYGTTGAIKGIGPSNGWVSMLGAFGKAVVYSWTKDMVPLPVSVLRDGGFVTESFVLSTNNSLFTMTTQNPFILGARFNGQSWILKEHPSGQLQKITLGEQFFQFNQPFGTSGRYTFNPNTNSWGALENLGSPTQLGSGDAMWGYFFQMPKIHKVERNGTWNNNFYTTSSGKEGGFDRSYSSGPKFFLYNRADNGGIYFYIIRNGVPEFHSKSGQYGSQTGVSAGTSHFVTFNNIAQENSTSVTLFKILDGEYEGSITDRPIQSISVNNGFETTHTAYDFSAANASTDISGHTALYNLASVARGTSSMATTPYGKTETYYFNGKVSASYLTGVSSSSPLVRGLSYKRIDYLLSGTSLVEHSKQENYYKRYSNNILNSESDVIETKEIIVPYKNSLTQDGVTKDELHFYNSKYQLQETQVTNYDAEGNTDLHKNQYIYYWEKYDEELISPVVQTKNVVNNVVKSSTVTTWQSELPFRTYQQIAAGSDFADWASTGTVSSNWLKISQNTYDANDNVIEVIDRDGTVNSTFYVNQNLPILTVENASHTEIWAENFDDGSITDTESHTWSTPVGSSYWSFSNGVASFQNSASTGIIYTTVSNAFSGNYIFEFDLRLGAGSGSASFHIDKPSGGYGYRISIGVDGTINLYDNNTLIATGETNENLSRWQPIRLVQESNVLHLYVGNKKVIRKSCTTKSGNQIEIVISNLTAAFDNLRVYPSDAYATSTSYDQTYRIPVQVKNKSGSSNYFALDEFNRPYSVSDHNMNPNGSSASFNAYDFGAVSETNPSISFQAASRGTTGYSENFDIVLDQWVEMGSENASSSLWQLQNGYLRHVNTGTGASGMGGKYVLSLPEAVTGNRVAVDIQITTGTLYNQTFGFGLGSSNWNLLESSASIWTYFSGHNVSVNGSLASLNLSSGRTYRIIAVLDFSLKKVDFYLDGKQIGSDLPFKSNTVNDVGKLTLFNYGLNEGISNEWKIDNLLIYSDPIISSSFSDAIGQVRQTQSELPGNKVFVGETFYDDLNRPHVQTRSLEVTGSLGFRTSFAGWDPINRVLTGTEVVNAFGNLAYQATLFENSPLGRAIESKVPGGDFVFGGSRTSRFVFGNNNTSGLNIDDDVSGYAGTLPNSKYFVTKSINPDGLEQFSLTDQLGNTILTKSGTVKGLETTSSSQVFINNSIVEYTIYSPIAQTVSFEIDEGLIVGDLPAIDLPEGFDLRIAYPTLKISSTPGASGNILTFTNVGTGTFSVPAGNFYVRFSGGAGEYACLMDWIGSINEQADIYIYSKTSYNDSEDKLYSYPPNYFNSSISISERNSFISYLKYDFSGRVVEKVTPDEGKIEYKFSKEGRLRYVQDAQGRLGGYFTYYKYDIYGKLIEEGYITAVFASADPNNAGYPSTPSTWRKKYFHGLHENTTYDRRAVTKVEVNDDDDTSAEVVEEYEILDGDLYVNSIKRTLVGESVILPVICYTRNNLNQVVKMQYLKSVESSIGETITTTETFQGETVEIDGTTIESGGSLTVVASKAIKLGPGFHAKLGSYFTSSVGASLADTEEVTYVYDIAGRLISIGSESDPDIYARYLYGTNGALIQESLNNASIPIDYTYYPDKGWLNGISQGSRFSETLEYTTNAYGSPSGYYTGLISKISTSINGLSYSTSYKYDKSGRLLAADHSNNTYDVGVGSDIRYDRNGNILQMKSGSTTFGYSYLSGSNKLASISPSAGNYTYDAVGNVTSNVNKGLTSLTYDQSTYTTKSISVSGSGLTEFQYGATDLRTMKSDQEGGNTYKTWYMHGEGIDPLVQTTSAPSGSNTYKFIYGLTGLVAFKKGSQLFFVVKDHLGSTRLVMNSANTVLNHLSYLPFGGLMSAYTNISENLDYQYTGQEYDEETGLYNYKARLYDELAGRFYSVDPAGQYYSPFVAMGNNPVSMIDPTGREGYDPSTDPALLNVEILITATRIHDGWGGANLGGYSNSFTFGWAPEHELIYPTGLLGSQGNGYSGNPYTPNITTASKYAPSPDVQRKAAEVEVPENVQLPENLAYLDSQSEISRELQYVSLDFGLSGNMSFFSGSYSGGLAFSDESMGFKVSSGIGAKNSKFSSWGIKVKLSVSLVYSQSSLKNETKSWQAFSTIGRDFGLGGTGLFSEVKSTNSSSGYNYGVSFGLQPSIGVGSPATSVGTQFSALADVTPYSDFTNKGLWRARLRRIWYGR